MSDTAKATRGKAKARALGSRGPTKARAKRAAPAKVNGLIEINEEKYYHDTLETKVHMLFQDMDIDEQALLGLTYANGSKIITLSNLGVLVEIRQMFDQLPANEVWEILHNAVDAKNILWDQPSMEAGRRAVEQEINLQQLEESQGVEGIETCKYCQCKRVNIRAKQTRSADEPMTIRFTCPECGKSWTK